MLGEQVIVLNVIHTLQKKKEPPFKIEDKGEAFIIFDILQLLS